MDSFASTEVVAELPYTIVKIGGKPSWKHREDSEQGYRFLAEVRGATIVLFIFDTSFSYFSTDASLPLLRLRLLADCPY